MKKIIFLVICLSCFTFVKANDEVRSAYVALNEAYTEYNATCDNEEKLAIIKFANGKLINLNAGYDAIINLTTRSGNPMSFMCANDAADLYKALIHGKQVVMNADTTLSAMTLASDIEQKTNLFVVGSGFKHEDGMTILDNCNFISNDAKEVINRYFGYVQVAAISIAIVLCVLDIYKIMMSGKAENKKALKTFMKRIVAIIVVLAIPFIVNVFISLINSYISIDAINCLES